MRAVDAETIGGAVEACRQRLTGLVETPWLDARLLAGHVLGLDASAIVAYSDHPLDTRRRQRVLALAERRAAGEPVAYLVGFKEFCGLRVQVDRRVLVPRPETEELTLAVVDDWRGKAPQILELGTGSGAIACALAHLLSRASIVATDLSAAALEVAAVNVAQLGLSERVELVRGDLFAPLSVANTYDVIVANLPYVAEEDPDVSLEVLAHEPTVALHAGPDGLSVYQRMFEAAPKHLRPDGRLYCECGPSTARAVCEMAKAAFKDHDVAVRRDLGGRDRMVIVA